MEKRTEEHRHTLSVWLWTYFTGEKYRVQYGVTLLNFHEACCHEGIVGKAKWTQANWN